MRGFAYHRPVTLDEALEVLHQHGDSCKVLAGGTALLLLMRNKLIAPPVILDVGGIRELAGVRVVNGHIQVGALTTHRAVERSADMRKHCAVLAEMARQAANLQVRNRGTIGGNLCHADPASDPPTLLLALDATCTIRSSLGGAREVTIGELITGYYQTSLSPEDLLVAITVPRLSSDVRAAYLRFVASAEDRPIATVGARLRLDGDRRCRDIRVAIGAVGAVPVRAIRMEERLLGEVIDRRLVAETADLAVDGLEALDDFRASAEYRLGVARVLVRRVLEQCLSPYVD